MSFCILTITLFGLHYILMDYVFSLLKNNAYCVKNDLSKSNYIDLINGVNFGIYDEPQLRTRPMFVPFQPAKTVWFFWECNTTSPPYNPLTVRSEICNPYVDAGLSNIFYHNYLSWVSNVTYSPLKSLWFAIISKLIALLICNLNLRVFYFLFTSNLNNSCKTCLSFNDTSSGAWAGAKWLCQESHY